MEKEILKLPEEDRKILFEVLGYKINSEGFVTDKNDKKLQCPFTKMPVELKKASILPGSLVIMNTSPVTLSEYFFQYPDD